MENSTANELLKIFNKNKSRTVNSEKQGKNISDQ
jgi:hypothetical protein